MEKHTSATQKQSEDIRRAVSPLRMSNFHFSNIQLSFSGKKFDGTKMRLNVSHEIHNTNSDRVSVTAEIMSEPESLTLKLIAEAVFFLDSDDGNIFENPLIKQNTVAIMFPFIRSEITLLTSQPGMSPIVIPPLNIKKLLSETQPELGGENS